MKQNILSAVRISVCRPVGNLLCALLLIVTVLSAVPLPVCARERQTPHLIQTVTERDIFEGLLALGFLESPVMEAGDCETAYENVKDCVVRIHMENAYGSGVVWEITPEQVVIVTNKHVLEYWQDSVSYIQFPQGYFTEAEILDVSEEYDIGFLIVDNTEFDYPELERLRYVHHDMETYRTLQTGDALFCVGAENTAFAGTTPNFYQGSIGDVWRYIDEFEEYMLYGYGYAREGMSGGGTFDAKGNFIGMISGATMNGETASVPLPLILRAYGQIQDIL